MLSNIHLQFFIIYNYYFDTFFPGTQKMYYSVYEIPVYPQVLA